MLLIGGFKMQTTTNDIIAIGFILTMIAIDKGLDLLFDIGVL
jgi:hypothetical protein